MKSLEEAKASVNRRRATNFFNANRRRPKLYADEGPWCSWPTRLPVTEEIAGSSPVGPARISAIFSIVAEFEDFAPDELELVANVHPASYPRFPMRVVAESLDITATLISRYGRENIVRGEPTQIPPSDWIGLYVIKAEKDKYESENG